MQRKVGAMGSLQFSSDLKKKNLLVFFIFHYFLGCFRILSLFFPPKLPLHYTSIGYILIPNPPQNSKHSFLLLGLARNQTEYKQEHKRLKKTKTKNQASLQQPLISIVTSVHQVLSLEERNCACLVDKVSILRRNR